MHCKTSHKKHDLLARLIAICKVVSDIEAKGLLFKMTDEFCDEVYLCKRCEAGQTKILTVTEKLTTTLQ
jgi:hypothetical protein